MQLPGNAIFPGKIVWIRENFQNICHYHSKGTPKPNLQTFIRNSQDFLISLTEIAPHSEIYLLPPLPRRHLVETKRCSNCLWYPPSQIDDCIRSLKHSIQLSPNFNHVQIFFWHEVNNSIDLSRLSPSYFSSDLIHLNTHGLKLLTSLLENLFENLSTLKFVPNKSTQTLSLFLLLNITKFPYKNII